jgi:transposase
MSPFFHPFFPLLASKGVGPVAISTFVAELPELDELNRGQIAKLVVWLRSTTIRVRAFYQSLLAQGKPKKLALVAAMRKLLTIINTLIKCDELWQEPAAK